MVHVRPHPRSCEHKKNIYNYNQTNLYPAMWSVMLVYCGIFPVCSFIVHTAHALYIAPCTVHRAQCDSDSEQDQDQRQRTADSGGYAEQRDVSLLRYLSCLQFYSHAACTLHSTMHNVAQTQTKTNDSGQRRLCRITIGWFLLLTI